MSQGPGRHPTKAGPRAKDWRRKIHVGNMTKRVILHESATMDIPPGSKLTYDPVLNKMVWR